MPLAAAPDCHVVIARPVRGGGVRLYVALVDGAGAELALDYHVGLREALAGIAQAELEAVGDVGLILRVAPAAGPERRAVHREKTLVEYRGAVLHGVLGAEHRRQNLVVNVYQIQRALGCGWIRRRDSRHDVALVQRLLPGYDVSAIEAVVDRRALGLVYELSRDVGHILSRDRRLDAGQRQRAGYVYGANARVGVRTAEQLPVEHTRQVYVRAVPRPACNLVQPVGPDWALAYYFVAKLRVG